MHNLKKLAPFVAETAEKHNSVVLWNFSYSAERFFLCVFFNSHELQYYLIPYTDSLKTTLYFVFFPNILSKGLMFYLNQVPSKCSSQKYLYIYT